MNHNNSVLNIMHFLVRPETCTFFGSPILLLWQLYRWVANLCWRVILSYEKFQKHVSSAWGWLSCSVSKRRLNPRFIDYVQYASKLLKFGIDGSLFLCYFLAAVKICILLIWCDISNISQCIYKCWSSVVLGRWLQFSFVPIRIG